MRVVGTDVLHAFCGRHADCRSWIRNWLAEVRAARWLDTHDIKSKYSAASFLPGNLVIFNVRGNEYRLEVQVSYLAGILRVTWIGTHAEYSKRR